MKIERIVGGMLESNGYILYQEGKEDCHIIDPGYQYKHFMNFMEKKGLRLKAILLTHHHYDHVGAVQNLVTATGCPVFLHREDHGQYKALARIMEDGQIFDIAGEALRVIHTPGHTEGGVCFFSDRSKAAFTGDTIFNVDLGRTDLEDGDPAKMAASIRDIIASWPNDITIYPGHGDPCTMKYVRQHNREFLDVIEGRV